ncbi:hypothetical protein [Roseovarius arcticus]|uniref:hypothetical protein n=1 Tax=Roseovarius arcticus TaxID=2547404 RepID=UPI00111035AA|nr:hypothetical protein [Roseovarius arcticus]
MNSNFELGIPDSVAARHARLFELLRQQQRAQCVAQRMKGDTPEAQGALTQIARRAAASWQKMR